jgi:hypothetical protein
MSVLLLLLSLSGVLPGPALASGALGRVDGVVRLSVAPEWLLLDVELEGHPSGLDELGETLGRGIALFSLPGFEPRIGLEGQPSAPFLSNFMHAHELRMAPRVDPEAVANSLMVQIRVDLD